MTEVKQQGDALPMRESPAEDIDLAKLCENPTAELQSKMADPAHIEQLDALLDRLLSHSVASICHALIERAGGPAPGSSPAFAMPNVEPIVAWARRTVEAAERSHAADPRLRTAGPMAAEDMRKTARRLKGLVRVLEVLISARRGPHEAAESLLLRASRLSAYLHAHDFMSQHDLLAPDAHKALGRRLDERRRQKREMVQTSLAWLGPAPGGEDDAQLLVDGMLTLAHCRAAGAFPFEAPTHVLALLLEDATHPDDGHLEERKAHVTRKLFICTYYLAAMCSLHKRPHVAPAFAAAFAIPPSFVRVLCGLAELDLCGPAAADGPAGTAHGPELAAVRALSESPEVVVEFAPAVLRTLYLFRHLKEALLFSRAVQGVAETERDEAVYLRCLLENRLTQEAFLWMRSRSHANPLALARLAPVLFGYLTDRRLWSELLSLPLREAEETALLTHYSSEKPEVAVLYLLGRWRISEALAFINQAEQEGRRIDLPKDVLQSFVEMEPRGASHAQLASAVSKAAGGFE